MLNIGGTIGALVVTMPADLVGVEIEIIPTGTDSRTNGGPSHPHNHDHHEHEHDHEHHASPPHVAVVPRPVGNRQIPSAVFGQLPEGTYDLYVRPDGAVTLTVTVTAGHVALADWPANN